LDFNVDLFYLAYVHEDDVIRQMADFQLGTIPAINESVPTLFNFNPRQRITAGMNR
jgi:hypothetical protein